ncbi:Thermophilic serine proteinase precursor [Slackia heliotrinireducens]|uniref:Subtilase family protease n=1 Tax=Slackia heliotrinireducens (strain ATCC 29202 / DSM 20476 / NCTC 11029 / RHS 1) TaxID=471855 RepID=C7N6C9_SLAHD|nr:subtilase family protease [Slackia heliotrinireducens DSM 20476]VEH00841.1 Thermophilic serine proteinase precursor [Slackia heliotrinireducens]
MKPAIHYIGAPIQKMCVCLVWLCMLVVLGGCSVQQDYNPSDISFDTIDDAALQVVDEGDSNESDVYEPLADPAVTKGTDSVVEASDEPGLPDSEIEDFEQLLVGGSGESGTVADVPTDAYDGYIVSVDEERLADFQFAMELEAAVDAGVLTPVAGNFYTCNDYRSLPGTIHADMVESIEPDYYVEAFDDGSDEGIVPDVRPVLESESGLDQAPETASDTEVMGDAVTSDTHEADASDESSEPDTDESADVSEAAKSEAQPESEETDETSEEPVETQAIKGYNDPRISEQWYLTSTNASAAWAAGYTGAVSESAKGVRPLVAIVDTGLCGTGSSSVKHEDINYGNVVAGWNVVAGSYDTAPVSRHGTMCAGIIGAEQNNGKGIAGLVPDAAMAPVMIFGDSGSTSVSNLIAGIYAGVDYTGANVMNLSVGVSEMYFENHSISPLQAAVDYAASKNVLMVAAVGNYGTGSNPLMYPAGFSNVVGVGGVSQGSLDHYPSSEFNDSVYCVAPGQNILSTAIANKSAYSAGSGTSYAAPMVSALAAMCKSVDGSMTVSEFKKFIRSTSTDLGASGYDIYYGYGVINFNAAAKQLNAMGGHVSREGWVLEDGGQYYYVNDSPVCNAWKRIDGYWYYFKSDGRAAASEWEKVGSYWYHFDSSGHMQKNRWLKSGGGWYYLGSNGAALTGWQKLSYGGSSKWFYFNGDCKMLTGLQTIRYGGSDKVFYFDGSGVMVTGWQKAGGHWYYFGGDGAGVTGWQKLAYGSSTRWYYFNGDATMATGWKKIRYAGADTWFYFGGDGAMRTGTQTIGGKTYRFASNGAWIG